MDRRSSKNERFSNTEPLQRSNYWELAYESAGSDRLWPSNPTIGGLDLELLRARGIHLVLDAGCGDGKNQAFLAKNGFIVVGADASVTALERCNAYMLEEGLGERSLLLKKTKLESIPLADASLQAVICIDVLGHLPVPQPVIVELARVLKPKGLLYASTFHPDDSCRTGPRIRRGRGGGYWYRPSVPDRKNPTREYFYRFYDERQARSLFSCHPFGIISVEARSWKEPGHKGYREEPHGHVSWFGLMEKK